MSVRDLLDFILHLDTHLNALLSAYGALTYAVLFVVIFLETGVVVTPFLPGDSLLFAAGALAARGSLDRVMLVAALSAAAVLGDTVNYWIGSLIGPRVFRERSRWFRRDYLDRTHRFYETYGGITIVLARFVPIFRTFVPFVAGIGRMTYWRFLVYNVAGGVAWVTMFVLGGYLFGNLPVVRRNFTLVMAAIVLLSLIPAVVEVIRHRSRSSSEDRARRAGRPRAG
jgi:membrane-associated protein